MAMKGNKTVSDSIHDNNNSHSNKDNNSNDKIIK